MKNNIEKTEIICEALETIKYWSKTFYEPILILPEGVKESVSSTYLTLRAIDEIEDNNLLSQSQKINLLKEISLILQDDIEEFSKKDFEKTFWGYQNLIPEVTLNLHKWVNLAPQFIAPRVRDMASSMADRMAHWVSVKWKIQNEKDLNKYSYAVSGTVALLLADIFIWHDSVSQINRHDAIGYGNFLQSVNIIRGREDDLKRGVDFFPENWTIKDMQNYARRNQKRAESFVLSINNLYIQQASQKLLDLSLYALSKSENNEKIEFDGIKKP